jgi:hypothetical protein
MGRKIPLAGIEVDNMTTRDLEHAIFHSLSKTGTYLCFEVMMPRSDGLRLSDNNERVDLLSYDTKGTWRFYELKISVSDFHSKCKTTFKGHYNYYVLPHEIYRKVKDEIPQGVGVWTATYYENYRRILCDCIVKPKRQPLAVNEEHLKFSFMQALSREHRKYRMVLEHQGEGAK